MNNRRIIEISGLRKTYDYQRYILDEINLELSEGDMAIIEGKSGAGKSTLMNVMGLLDSFSEGEYIIDGINVLENKRKNSMLRAKKIGFVFQAYHLLDNMSVYDNILLPYLYNGQKVDNQVIQHMEELLKEFGLQEMMNKKVSLLSGGEKQRVAIIRAIIKNPQVIIADEPTGNLDYENTEIIINAFRKLRNQGKTIIVVTHDLSIAKEEDKRFLLKEGKLELC